MDLNNLTLEQKEILDDYCADGAKKLDKICRDLIRKKNVPLYQEDDLYSLAQWTFLECIPLYDSSKNCGFDAFLRKCIWKSFYDWTRDSFYRAKRCNLQIGKDGKIYRDENGMPVIIQNISLDEKIENDLEWSEKIASDFKMEDNLSDEMCLSSDENEEWHDEVKTYLNSLSPLQRKIIFMIVDGKEQDEICGELHITVSHYNNSLKRLMTSEKIDPLRPLVEKENRRPCNY